MAVYQDFAGCVQPQFEYAVGGSGSQCTTAYDVYELGAPFSGLFWVKDQSDICQGPYAAGANPRYWMLGRKLDPSELVEATLP